MKKEIWIFVLLIFLLTTVNYSFLDRALTSFLDESEQVVVERVIDGDTIVINGTSIRMLGINTPEKGKKYSVEAKKFLESLVINKTIILKFGRERTDKYKRTLAYVFVGNTNVNEKLIENGFANYYFPSGKDEYYESFVEAWKRCLQSNINLCEKSGHICANCVSLEKKKDHFILRNLCAYDCNIESWAISGEGRKTEIFPKMILNIGEEVKIYETGFSGDIFIRDSESRIILWERV